MTRVKDLQVGDELFFVNSGSNKEFAKSESEIVRAEFDNFCYWNQ